MEVWCCLEEGKVCMEFCNEDGHECSAMKRNTSWTEPEERIFNANIRPAEERSLQLFGFPQSTHTIN
jgi:hypothetical protein